MKNCTVCTELKDLTEFYADARTKDGKQACCKVCQRVKTLAWCAANPEKVKASTKKWQQANKAKMNANSSRYYKKMRAKARAYEEMTKELPQES